MYQVEIPIVPDSGQKIFSTVSDTPEGGFEQWAVEDVNNFSFNERLVIPLPSAGSLYDAVDQAICTADTLKTTNLKTFLQCLGGFIHRLLPFNCDEPEKLPSHVAKNPRELQNLLNNDILLYLKIPHAGWSYGFTRIDESFFHINSRRFNIQNLLDNTIETQLYKLPNRSDLVDKNCVFLHRDNSSIIKLNEHQTIPYLLRREAEGTIEWWKTDRRISPKNDLAPLRYGWNLTELEEIFNNYETVAEITEALLQKTPDDPPNW